MGGAYSGETPGVFLTPEEEEAVGIVPDEGYVEQMPSEAAHMRRRQRADDYTDDSTLFTEMRKEEEDVKLQTRQVSQERLWLNAVGEEPKNCHIRVQYANYLSSLERFDEAAFQFKEAIKFDSSSVLAHYDLAFMRHHQFYLYFAKNKVSEALECSKEAIAFYHKVLILEENDVETHYQLALLYLTQLETCLPTAIDDIHSPVSSIAHQSICESKGHATFRGRHSPWFSERLELIDLCRRHVTLTMDYVTEFDPVAFGTHITAARLAYLRCMPPLVFSLTTACTPLAEDCSAIDGVRLANERESQEICSKLLLEGIGSLRVALELNGEDATVHHDLALLLSHDCVRRFYEAESHWRQAHELDPENYLYLAQLGFLFQYKESKPDLAIECYEAVLRMYDKHFQVWNNLGILRAQKAVSKAQIGSAAQCWRRALALNGSHPEAHQNLGNVLWLHLSDWHSAEIHLQRSISILKQLANALQNRGEELDQCKKAAEERAVKKTTRRRKVGFGSSSVEGYVLRKRKYQHCSERRFVDLMQSKVCKLIAQCKSDYGGLLLMMLGHDSEALRELKEALSLDGDCVSAHYYVGKLLFEKHSQLTEARTHLLAYLRKEHLANLVNKAHAQQLVGDICRRLREYGKGEAHFSTAIELVSRKLPPQCPTIAMQSPALRPKTGSGTDEKWRSQLPLPMWALLKMHAGLADCIVLRELKAVRSSAKAAASDGLPLDKVTVSRINIAKSHYRIALKYARKCARAHLGLGRISSYFLLKPRRAEHHFQQTIEFSRAAVSDFKEERSNEQRLAAAQREERRQAFAEDVSEDSAEARDWQQTAIHCGNVRSLAKGTQLEVLREALDNEVSAHLELCRLLLAHFKTPRVEKDCLRLCIEALTIDKWNECALLTACIVLWELKRTDDAANVALYCVAMARLLKARTQADGSAATELAPADASVFKQAVAHSTKMGLQQSALHSDISEEHFTAALFEFIASL